MAETKTKATEADVYKFINSFASSEQKKKDSLELIKVLKDITGEEPKMWGPTIIGFGTYHYKYKSGHEGDAPVLGFSPLPRDCLPTGRQSRGSGASNKATAYYSNKALEEGMSKFNEQLIQIGQHEKVLVLDLAARLAKSSDNFYDDFHFNERGAERVAEEILLFLRQEELVSGN